MLPNEAVGVFVAAALPRAVRVCKVNFQTCAFGEFCAVPFPCSGHTSGWRSDSSSGENASSNARKVLSAVLTDRNRRAETSPVHRRCRESQRFCARGALQRLARVLQRLRRPVLSESGTTQMGRVLALGRRRTGNGAGGGRICARGDGHPLGA